jgi:hypothetical protein
MYTSPMLTHSSGRTVADIYKERCYDSDMDRNVCVFNAVLDKISAQNRFIVAADAAAFATQSLREKRFVKTAPRRSWPSSGYTELSTCAAAMLTGKQ